MRNASIICTGLLLLFAAVHCTKKEPEVETPVLTITCPRDTTIQGGADYYTYYKAPEPAVYTNCRQGGLQLTNLSGGVGKNYFPVGTTTVAYRVTDACGNAASCSYRVTVQQNGPINYCNGIQGTPNFRKALVGLYAGQATIGANPAYLTSFPVCYDPDTPDHVIVSNDLVPLDSLCHCFPGQRFGNYRIYALRFKNDSVFFRAQLNGPLSHPEPVYTFQGKKIQ